MATLEVKLEHVGSIREAQQATLKFKSEQGLKIRVAEKLYAEYMGRGMYIDAAYVARANKLSERRVQSAAIEEFKLLMTGGRSEFNFNVDKIKELASKLSLSVNVIKEAAIEYYKSQVIILAMSGSREEALGRSKNNENIRQLVTTFGLSESDCLDAIGERRMELFREAKSRPHAKEHYDRQITAIDKLLEK
jgi:hypothetical protein